MISVTQILETFPEVELVAWQLRDPKRAKQVSEQALKIGSVVDRRVYNDVRITHPLDETATALTPVEVQAVESCWQGWQQFKTDHPDFQTSIVWMQRELIQPPVLGHPDFYLKRGSQFGICDLKCTTQIRPIHWTQAAAYSWLANAEENADFLAILRLDKTRATYEYVELTDPDQIDYEVQVWLCYKQLYQHRQRVAERSRLMKESEALDGV